MTGPNQEKVQKGGGKKVERWEKVTQMRQTTRRVLTSGTLGILLTVFGFVAACAARGTCLARVFYWQGYLLAHWLPAPNIGTADRPLYEATPIHVMAFFMGIPVGVVVYSVLAFAILARFSGRRKER